MEKSYINNVRISDACTGRLLDLVKPKVKIYSVRWEPHSVHKPEEDSMHMQHVLTLLNKYIISTRFAKKFLTWMEQLSVNLLCFQNFTWKCNS